jgi:hypothetical protein
VSRMMIRTTRSDDSSGLRILLGGLTWFAPRLHRVVQYCLRLAGISNEAGSDFLIFCLCARKGAVPKGQPHQWAEQDSNLRPLLCK